MDGASKFVKGDAVAGIIILLIDIIAGWIVGMVQMDMAWNDALSTFTLLTIGDGIVTQVPALIISVATGIIVTRSSADRQLSTEVFSQLSSIPKIPLIVLGALFLLLALPGMPKWPMVILMALALGAFQVLRRKKAAEEAQSLFDTPPADKEKPGGARGVPPVEILLGKDLGQHWLTIKPLLAERITILRTSQEKATGFSIPPVLFQDGAHLGPYEYEISLFGARHSLAQIHPEKILAVRASEAEDALPGIQTRDPAYGLPSIWIDPDVAGRAREMGYTLVDPVTVLMTHLGEMLRREAALLLTRSDVVGMLEGVRSRQPGLVEELVPAIMTVSDIQRVLQNLLSEDVSIRNVDQIAEALVDLGRTIKEHADLTELVRQRLSHGICHSLRGGHEYLSVLSLDPKVEGQISESVRRVEKGSNLILDPRLAEQLIRKLIPGVEAMLRESLAPVLLCSPEVRRYLKIFTKRSVPKLSVLSINEVPSTIDLRSFSIVKLD
jgi:flagellar biosynthesis protein FlhA